MSLFLYSWLSGIIGSVFMDVTEEFMAKKGISSGVRIEDIGRWFLSFGHGKFMHTDIRNVKPFRHEVITGKIFHYLVAGGGIALIFAAGLLVFGIGTDYTLVLYGMVFGLLTNVFPWFWLMPSFGWGICGLKSPQKSRTIIAPTISHIAYGLGLGISLWLLLKV